MRSHAGKPGSGLRDDEGGAPGPRGEKEGTGCRHPAGEGNRVAIDVVKRPENEACTMDLAPHTTLFWTPVEVTTTEPLTVEVLGTEVEVPIK